MQLFRYDDVQRITTSRDPLVGVLSWIKGLRSRSYLEDLIHDKHAIVLPAGHTVRHQAGIAKAHVTLASDYLEQALGGHESVSFLPLYYGLLNLAKTYTILGPYAGSLDSQRTHGAQFTPGKTVDKFLEDKIKFWRSGALALFYRTIVGATPPTDPSHNYLTIRIGDLYSCVPDLSAEYRIATGKWSSLRSAEVDAEQAGSYYRAKVVVHPSPNPIPGAKDRRYLPLVKGLRKAKDKDETYTGWPRDSFFGG